MDLLRQGTATADEAPATADEAAAMACTSGLLLLSVHVACCCCYCLWTWPEALLLPVPCIVVGQRLRVTTIGGSITAGQGAVGELPQARAQ